MEAYLLEVVSLRYCYICIRFIIVGALGRAGRTVTKHKRCTAQDITAIISEFCQLVVFDLLHRQFRQFFFSRCHYNLFVDRIIRDCDRGFAELSRFGRRHLF